MSITPPAPRRPNVIFIVADDLGYADLGCYGGRDADFGPVSPHLDALAVGGLRFTQGYSNSPVCSPTRFALMTGRYQYRYRGGCEEPINVRSKNSAVLGLPPDIPSLPSMLRSVGYRTALVGKWHLGYPPAFGPIRSGYEEFFGPMSGGVDYFDHSSNGGVHDLFEGEAEAHTQGYLTDLLTARAIDYIERRAAEPFFLSLHYTAPHFPWQTREGQPLPRDTAGGLFHLDGGNVAVYQRMIHHMDEGIGRIVATLGARGLDDSTLIVFTSDNGGERFSDNWPLVGGKMDLTEGGIRAPWIARWPGTIASGRVSTQQCMTMDWSATILDLAGHGVPPELDGVSLAAVLAAPERKFPRPLFWRMNHRGQRAHRDGDWKYLRVDGNDYLFNLSEDARERANLALRQPGRLAAMCTAWDEWNAALPPIPVDASVSPGYSVRDMPQR